MKIKKLIIFIPITVFMLLAVSVGLLSGFASSREDHIWYSEKYSVQRPVGMDDTEYITSSGKTLACISSYWNTLTKDDMLEQSALVVRGRVIGFDYLTIKPVTGGTPMVFTDYYVELLDTLRGVPYDEKQIIIRAQGGENEKMIMVNEDLSLTVGEDYLFFLDKPVSGGGYNTEGDYYYITSGSSGAYESSAETVKDERGEMVPKTFYPYETSELSKDAIDYLNFMEEIKTYNESHPVDEMYRLKRYEKDLQSNLDTGFITQEEYDRSHELIKTYATIVE